MATRLSSLTKVIADLETRYGSPPLPAATEPFEIVLWENVAYLVDDERRSTVYKRLLREVGSDPAVILGSPLQTLVRIIKEGGMHPERRARKLQTAAEIAIGIGPDLLGALVRDAPAKARVVLKRFPGIGDPGADKILLFARRRRTLALDSNALRVVIRLGFGEESNNYARMYRSAAEAVEPSLPDDFPWLIRAHQLLRLHGQETCKRSTPRCDICPVTRHCRWYRRDVAG